MKIVSVNDIKRDDVLARAVVNDNGNVLLYEGAILKPEHIEKITENGIGFVYVKNNNRTNTEVYSVNDVQKDCINKIKETINTRIRPEICDNEVEHQALKIIEEIIEKKVISECMISIHLENPNIYTHLISVTALSIIIGIKMGFNETQLKDTAVGALLHDVGLINSDIKYFDVDMERLPAEDKLKYKNHVITGYEILKNSKSISEVSKKIVLLHHERADESGYPFHTAGDKLTKELKVVSVCDHFDEMVNGIGYEKKKVHEIVEYFRTTGAYMYDYTIMKLFVSCIVWFENGSYVITNEGETACIVRQNKGLPDRPVLKIIKKADGELCNIEIIKDLTEYLSVFILDAIEI